MERLQDLCAKIEPNYLYYSLQQIKDFITNDLIDRNDFERVCMEINELKANDFRNKIIDKIAEGYYKREDFIHAYELIETYDLEQTILPDQLSLLKKHRDKNSTKSSETSLIESKQLLS